MVFETPLTSSANYSIANVTIATPISMGGYADCDWTGVFPAHIPLGTYYVGWVIDVDDDIYEDTNENNNIFYETSKTLTVETSSGSSGNGTPPPPPPDPIPFVVGGLVSAAIIIPAGIYFVSKRRV